MTLYSQYAAGSSKMINSSSETINILNSPTNSIRTINSCETMIYDGKKFWAEATVDVGATTADNTIYILGITSAKCTLMGTRNIQTYSSAAISVRVNLFEDVTCTTNSGNVTSFNMDRNLTSIGTFTINNIPATVSGGTQLPSINIIKSTATANFASSVSAEYKYSMKNNTKYALKIVNYGAATASATFLWTWSECDG